LWSVNQAHPTWNYELGAVVSAGSGWKCSTSDKQQNHYVLSSRVHGVDFGFFGSALLLPPTGSGVRFSLL